MEANLDGHQHNLPSYLRCHVAATIMLHLSQPVLLRQQGHLNFPQEMNPLSIFKNYTVTITVTLHVHLYTETHTQPSSPLQQNILFVCFSRNIYICVCDVIIIVFHCLHE